MKRLFVFVFAVALFGSCNQGAMSDEDQEFIKNNLLGTYRTNLPFPTERIAPSMYFSGYEQENEFKHNGKIKIYKTKNGEYKYKLFSNETPNKKLSRFEVVNGNRIFCLNSQNPTMDELLKMYNYEKVIHIGDMDNEIQNLKDSSGIIPEWYYWQFNYKNLNYRFEFKCPILGKYASLEKRDISLG